MRVHTVTALTASMLFAVSPASAQGTARTLVAVFAHGDDEGPVAPLLARYARDGAQVYLILATDGAQGGAHTTLPRGPELAKVRADEARCAASALGINPPIFLDFPDAKLGDFAADPSLLYRLTQRIAQELERLHPDALITWGPEGGTGHPDHRLVSDIVTQLVRAGAPGVPERLFYSYIAAEGLRMMNPARGAPPLLVPQAKYVTTRVPFTPADFEAGRRSMACHQTQFSEDVVRRLADAVQQALNGVMPLAPLFPADSGTDLFGAPK